MYFHRVIVAVALCLLLAGVASAQSVPGSITLRWTLPTTGCLQNVTPAVCNQPLTGSAALQAVHVWISTSPIVPDPVTNNGLPAAPPTLTLGAGATTASHTMTVTNGQTLYARVSARNPAANSALSAEVTKLIQIPVVPGVPTTVTIELTIASP